MKKLIILLCLFLMGCALWETREVVLGPSLSTLQRIKERHSKIFDKDISFCYDETLKMIENMDAVVYKKDKGRGYIIGMNFNMIFPDCINTTSVGFLFEKVTAGMMKVEVVSNNYNLADFVAGELFERLEGTKQLEKTPNIESSSEDELT